MSHRFTSLGLLAALAGLLLVAPASPANAQTICSDTANVGWETDIETLSVTGVIVEFEGCEDGAYVGIELITDDGDIPPNGPLGGQVDDERATFDVTPFEVDIRPVTGIRVYLELAGEPTPIVRIDVDQRFFNPAGNEQVGLRLTSTLTLAVGQEYVVPGDYPGYEPADCDELGVTEPENLVAEGAGVFEATSPGTHLACYRQEPGSGGGPGPGQPGAEVPEVLDEIIDGSDEGGTTDDGESADDSAAIDDDETTDVGGVSSEDQPISGQSPSADPASTLGELGQTGGNAIATFFVGFLLVVSGGALLRWRRGNARDTSAASS